MKVTLWGTRGSLPTPDHATTRYGGNTSCVEVRAHDETVLVLDAGTGIRSLGPTLVDRVARVDVLLTHLHMDHIQGLGFFAPLYVPGLEVHIWGPASPTMDLRTRLMRYLSPPLFPVRLRDLPCRLHLHEVPARAQIGAVTVVAEHVCHPGPTVGYRLEANGRSVTYLPDHEPALGSTRFPTLPEWTSGFGLAEGADLLIHDAQYTPDEYTRTVGWGHSSIPQAFAFAAMARVRHFVPFHHDPSHDDDALDALFARALDEAPRAFVVTPGKEGATFEV